MLRSETLQSQVVDFILEYIESNKLENGQRLPPQAQLAEMMGISVATLREAIKTLEAKGVLAVVNGKGIFVNTANPNLYSAQIELKKEKESLLDLLRVRRALEREILSLVIKRASDAEMNELGEVVGRLMRKYNAGEDQTQEDRAFHQTIYKISHSETLQSVIASIEFLLHKFQEFPLGMESPFTETIPLHEDLYHALRARKTRLAHKINNQIISQMIEDVKQA